MLPARLFRALGAQAPKRFWSILMKRCPECHRTYADDTLSFCLVDGSILSAPYENQATRPLYNKASQFPTEKMPDILKQAESTPSPFPTMPAGLPPPLIPELKRNSPLEKRSIKPWLALGVLALIILIGLIITVRYVRQSNGEKAEVESRPISDKALLTELVALHQQFYNAYFNGDIATVKRLLADDFNGGPDKDGKPIDRDKDGKPINKNEMLTDVKPNTNIVASTISDSRLVSRTEDSAIVIFTNTVNFKTGTPLTIKSEVTGRYVKREGRWQIASSTISN
jgi:hypothetical protein